MTMQTDLNVNDQEVKNGSQKLFNGVFGGMIMRGSIDLKGLPLFGLNLVVTSI